MKMIMIIIIMIIMIMIMIVIIAIPWLRVLGYRLKFRFKGFVGIITVVVSLFH